MKDINKVILSTFSVGDVIVIKKETMTWSSLCNSNYHFFSSITYPYTLTIKDIQYDEDSDHVAMTEGEFGWNLTELIESNCVDMKRYVRHEKLKRLNNIGI